MALKESNKNRKKPQKLLVDLDFDVIIHEPKIIQSEPKLDITSAIMPYWCLSDTAINAITIVVSIILIALFI